MEKSKTTKPQRKVTKKPPGNEFRAAANKSASKALAKGRNWTELETEVFATILSDSTNNFSYTLETKALKKSSNAEVFKAIQSEFRVSISETEFVEQNKMYESSTAE